ncbi:MAG: DUF2314 domain-containing protein [Pseudomonadota bacterium]
MTLREILGSIPGLAVLIGLALGGLWSWEQSRKRRARGLDIDTTDPIWLAALEKARASLPRFFELAEDYPAQAYVKYPLLTTKGFTEHVWGPVVSLREGTIMAGIETPPIDGRPATAPPYELQASQIEDWRVELGDGRIYGAYTARAQFEYARKLGHEITAHMLEVESRLVDA